MDPRTPKAFAQFSVILFVVAIFVGDPLAGFFFFIVAGILNALALVFGTKRVRLFALIWPKGHLRFLLIIIIVLAMWQYPDARRHFELYRERVNPDKPANLVPTNQLWSCLYCIHRLSGLL